MVAYRPILLLLGFLAASTAQAQDMKAAESFLKGIYATYKSKGKGVELTGPEGREGRYAGSRDPVAAR